MGPFVTQIAEIKRRARDHMDKGAVTAGYRADREEVVRVLNEALATEIICVLRYKRHYAMAQGIESESVAAEFAEHAREEQEHADRIAERITELGGEPNYNPTGLTERSHTEYVEGDTLVDMIKEDLVAERIAIEIYSEIVRWLGNDDPTTRRLVEWVLEKEEEHADDMANLLARLDIGAGSSQLRAERELSSHHGPVEPGTTVFSNPERKVASGGGGAGPKPAPGGVGNAVPADRVSPVRGVTNLKGEKL